MASHIGLFCCLCVFLFMDTAALQNGQDSGQGHSPVTLTSVSINENFDARNSTKVTIHYAALKPVKEIWTVDEGFSPTALDPNATVRTTNASSSIILPSTLLFHVMHVQLICVQELFELHLDLDKTRLSHGTYVVQQYDFYVPPKEEIGLSSKGESQFHVFVNLTGTNFSFGMIGADINGKSLEQKKGQLFTYSAFSFLPDFKDNNIRLRKTLTTESEKHYDVILKIPALFQHGGILSLLAACPLSNSVVKRMDMKQSIHIHPKSKPGIPFNFISLVDVGMKPRITVELFGKAFIRCKAIGNPTPALTLVKSSTNNDKYAIVQVPSYSVFLKFEITTTFQFLNVTASDLGHYACKASNGQSARYKNYVLSEQ